MSVRLLSILVFGFVSTAGGCMLIGAAVSRRCRRLYGVTLWGGVAIFIAGMLVLHVLEMMGAVGRLPYAPLWLALVEMLFILAVATLAYIANWHTIQARRSACGPGVSDDRGQLPH